MKYGRLNWMIKAKVICLVLLVGTCAFGVTHQTINSFQNKYNEKINESIKGMQMDLKWKDDVYNVTGDFRWLNVYNAGWVRKNTTNGQDFIISVVVFPTKSKKHIGSAMLESRYYTDIGRDVTSTCMIAFSKALDLPMERCLDLMKELNDKRSFVTGISNVIVTRVINSRTVVMHEIGHYVSGEVVIDYKMGVKITNCEMVYTK